MKIPEGKTVRFTLHSQPQHDRAARWKTTVVFHGGSDGNSFAEVLAVDGNDADIACGELEFAGQRIAIENGKGKLRCADFIAGKHECAIWMYRRGFAPVPGMLTFE